MRKHTITCDYDQTEENSLKKQKFQQVKTPRNKEIYSFKQDSFRTFDTCFIGAFCLHTTEPLVVISTCYPYYLRPPPESFARIYTLDGDLICMFDVSGYKGIYLSATMMITSNMYSYLTRYNDYSVKDSLSYCSCFSCDVNDNIYALPTHIDDDSISSIDIYSPDLEYVKPFKIQVCRCISSIRILEDTMAILSQSHSDHVDYVISRYSLSNAELLQTVEQKRGTFLKATYLSISFDPLSNILISSDSNERLAVWYVGDTIRYYKTSARYQHCKVIGAEMTKDFQLIRAMENTIRVYDYSKAADVFK